MTPEATAALLRAAHATTRPQARAWINVAVLRGLPIADARKALDEWNKANPVQRIGGCACGRPVPASSLDGINCAEHDSPITARPFRTDGGPSLREYLASKGEM